MSINECIRVSTMIKENTLVMGAEYLVVVCGTMVVTIVYQYDRYWFKQLNIGGDKDFALNLLNKDLREMFFDDPDNSKSSCG